MAIGLLPASSHAQVDALRQGWQSPEAAALGEYGDVPVGYYTGAPNIEVPLHTLSGRTLSIPIKLTYHASGIKVNQVPSWVGLGWALQAGGVITRQVRGLPDDKAGGYISTGSLLYEAGNWPFTPNQYVNPAQDVGTYLYKYYAEEADPEPDLYFFNFAGRSGKFVYGPDGASAAPEAHLMPHQNLRIEPNSDTHVSEWTITDEDGTQYVFSAAEQTNEVSYVPGSSSSGGSERDYTSAWHLTEIRSASGEDVIDLHYTTITTSQMREKTAEREVIYGGTCDIKEGTITGKEMSYTNLNLSVSTPYLDRIEAAGGTVHFEYDADARLDAPFGAEGLPQLEQVRIEGPAGAPSKSFQLGYGYFQEDSDEARRLKLTSVQEVGQGGTPIGGSYRFDYATSPDLPPFGSHDTDHWGYYNGANNFDTSLPEMRVNGELLSGADRSPSAGHMLAGLLERITYPTGGHTTFEFEPHKYSRVEGQRWNDTEPETVVKREHVSLVNEVARRGDNYFGSGEELVKEIQVQSQSPIKMDIEVRWPTEEGFNGSPQFAGAPLVRVREPGETSQINLTPGNTGTDPSDPVSNTTTAQTLQPGTYEIVLTGVSVCASGCDLDFADIRAFNVSVAWPELVDVEQPKQRIGGGVRIAEMRSHDGTGRTPDQVRRFVYQSRSDSERSSGMLIRAPVYRHEVTPSECPYTERSTNSRIPLGSAGGPSIGYRTVKVLRGENGEYGEERYQYSLPVDAHDFTAGWTSFLRPTSHDWYRGLRQNMYVRRAGSSGQEEGLVRREATQREIVGENPADAHPLVTRLRARYMQGAQNFFGARNDPSDTRKYFEEAAYYIVAGWHHPTEQTVTTYDPATGDSVTTTTSFQYQSSNNVGQLRSKTKTTADGQERKTTYTYAHEVALANGGGSSGMGPEGTHQLSQRYAVTVEDGDGGADLSKQWTTWQDNPQAAGTNFVPDEEHLWTGAGGAAGEAPSFPGGPETLLQKTYVNYDPHGRPIETESALGQRVQMAYQGAGGQLSSASTEVPSLTDPLEVIYDYDARGLLSRITGENGDSRCYFYDGLARLEEVRFRENSEACSPSAGTRLARHAYRYGDPALGDPSYVETERFGGGGGPDQVQATFLDGLGRPVQEQSLLGGGEAAVTQTGYDAMGRPFKQWRPVRVSLEE